jgi:hypothetical protein
VTACADKVCSSEDCCVPHASCADTDCTSDEAPRNDNKSSCQVSVRVCASLYLCGVFLFVPELCHLTPCRVLLVTCARNLTSLILQLHHCRRSSASETRASAV